MRALGIDPGSITTGYGVVDFIGPGRHSFVAEGSIKPKKNIPLEEKILLIANEIELVIEKYKPEVCVIESLFFAKNVKSAITLAQVRGGIILCARQNGLELSEYSPLEVKQSVTGFGRATKEQVYKMVKVLLNIKETSSLDSSDALAVALCHLACFKFNKAVGK